MVKSPRAPTRRHLRSKAARFIQITPARLQGSTKTLQKHLIVDESFQQLLRHCKLPGLISNERWNCMGNSYIMFPMHSLEVAGVHKWPLHIENRNRALWQTETTSRNKIQSGLLGFRDILSSTLNSLGRFRLFSKSHKRPSLALAQFHPKLPGLLVPRQCVGVQHGHLIGGRYIWPWHHSIVFIKCSQCGTHFLVSCYLKISGTKFSNQEMLDNWIPSPFYGQTMSNQFWCNILLL